MDEKIEADISEALGKATAVICIQAALIEMLGSKNLLASDDVSTLLGLANGTLEHLPGVSDGSRLMAQAALRGFASVVVKKGRPN
jgi:hypothetical protein